MLRLYIWNLSCAYHRARRSAAKPTLAPTSPASLRDRERLMARNHRSGRDNAVQKTGGRAGTTPAPDATRSASSAAAGAGARSAFPTVEGLRPSPDRVRETLFNWLAPVIRGTRCLDLFAGSGALGFEALSRGAASVVLVERDRAVANHLRQLASRARRRECTGRRRRRTGLAGPDVRDLRCRLPRPALRVGLAAGGTVAPGAHGPSRAGGVRLPGAPGGGRAAGPATGLDAAPFGPGR